MRREATPFDDCDDGVGGVCGKGMCDQAVSLMKQN